MLSPLIDGSSSRAWKGNNPFLYCLGWLDLYFLNILYRGGLRVVVGGCGRGLAYTGGNWG